MPNNRAFIISIKGSNPEQFRFLTMDEGYETIAHTSDPLTEDELRMELQRLKIPETEITIRIENARKHPI